jgi:dTDP-4-amino-4,6-dideoxygalactose transaminase
MQPSEGVSSGRGPSALVPAVPLLDVQRQYAPLREEIRAAVTRVCDSGRFILGPDCEELERAIAAYTRTRHAIACASGSDALLLALMALGIGPGDEVILPSFTFFATASAVWRLGAMPVFVDIDPVTFNLCPNATRARITRATKAILPVHLFGQCAHMDALAEIARPHKLPIIEDACQAIGAVWRGVPAGGLGDVACFSFYPTKNLGGFGDGGMLTTNRDDLAAQLRLLRVHGMEPRYYHQIVGINSRLDSIQAAVLNVKLPHLDDWAKRRSENATRYDELFRGTGLARLLTLPKSAGPCTHVWNQYTIRVPDGRRDSLRQYLAQMKIGTEIYYPVPLHRQACFTSLSYAEGSLPESERAAREVLSLPIFPELEPAEIETVVYRIAEFFGIRRGQIEPTVRRPHFLGHPAPAETVLPKVA